MQLGKKAISANRIRISGTCPVLAACFLTVIVYDQQYLHFGLVHIHSRRAGGEDRASARDPDPVRRDHRLPSNLSFD